MTFKFKSQAAADLLMLQAHAQQVLQLIGKDASGSGILEPADMPAALAALKSLPEADQHNDEADKPSRQDDNEADSAGRDVPQQVSLRQRAWPFIQMIEQAQAAGKPIVWGV